MIVIGIILLVVGIALAYLVPEPLARFAGAVLVVLGLILVLLGVLDGADVDTHDGLITVLGRRWT